MLHDLTFLESQPPVPTCPHMDRCSLSLYLDGCASCSFMQSPFHRHSDSHGPARGTAFLSDATGRLTTGRPRRRNR